LKTYSAVGVLRAKRSTGSIVQNRLAEGEDAD
jgi:hypothetical protein